MRPLIGSLALVGAVACTRGAAVESTGCASDDDCVWASGCCNDCTSYTGRAAGDQVVFRSEQERVDRACQDRGSECPAVNCPEPQPCSLPLGPVCRANRCTVVAGGPPVSRREGATCVADACGSSPVFDGGKCDVFAQAAYERCACIAAGRADCGDAKSSVVCHLRSACAPASSSPMMATVLAGCDGA